jgi:putative heme-binding domain-containing protein
VYPDAETPTAILKAYPSLSAAEKTDAVQTLASRPAFATALLDAVEKGTVPKSDVTAFTARQILALNDRAVTAKLEKVWGTIRPASATRSAQTAKLKSLLTPDLLQSADLANGRAVYARSCASCHRLFGEGGDVGPELTGSQRANLDYVLENVLDPSAVVPGEYRMTAFTLTDGRVLTGIVRRETKQAVTVRTVNEEVTVPVGEIEARRQTPHSVMPDGLLDALTDAEIRDLVAYLASPRQVPLPANGKQ